MRYDLNAKLHLIKWAQIAYIKRNNTYTKFWNKYIDFINVFFGKIDYKTP